jgi:hypothetical protein
MNKLAKAFQKQSIDRKNRLELIENTELSRLLVEKWNMSRESYLNEAADLIYKQNKSLEETIYILSEKFSTQIVGSKLVETKDLAYKFAENILLSEPDIQEEI